MALVRARVTAAGLAPVRPLILNTSKGFVTLGETEVRWVRKWELAEGRWPACFPQVCGSLHPGGLGPDDDVSWGAFPIESDRDDTDVAVIDV